MAGVRLRNLLPETAVALALAAIPLGASWIGSRGPSSVVFELGPNDAAYISGFAPVYEIDEQGATRWSGYRASVDLPLTVVGGPVTLSYRFARVLPQTAMVEVLLDRRQVDGFTCRGGEYQVRTVRLEALPPTPLVVGFRVDSHDLRGLGLRFDWLRLEFPEQARIGLRGWAFWRPTVFVLLLSLLFRWCGFSPTWCYRLTAPWALIQAAWAMNDPFGLAHVGSKLAFPALALGAACHLLLRRRPSGRWAVVVFLGGYLLKGAGVFAPTYFYPDVMNHRRYVFAFIQAEGGLVERGVQAQRQVKTAYPRWVAGKAYAFPYSPVFFVPFSWLPRDAELIEDALRHVGLALGAAEVVVVFWLSGLVFGPRSGALAALASALLPVMHNRLLQAQWPTVAGHFLDSLVLGAALLLASRPESLRRLAVLAGLTLASLLAYVSSLFNLGLFLGVLGLLERRLTARLFLVLATASFLTVAFLYGSFTLVFLREIVPALWSGPPTAAAVSPAPGLGHALARFPLFFGWGFPAFAAIGLVSARRHAPPERYRVLLAYGLAFCVLVGLRGLSGGLFKDLKEMLFVAPLIALLAGAGLEALATLGAGGRLATALVVLGLAGFGLSKYRQVFQAGQLPQPKASWTMAVGGVSTGLPESARLTPNRSR